MLRVILSLFFALSVTACSTAEKKADTPEGLFAVAQEFEQNERYELAIQRYTEVKNKFPYSSFATKAELAIADVHYKNESWPEAQVSYQAFKELHPTHPQIPYVSLRVGLSFYNQLPETVDRDLTLAKDAITAFDEVLRRFPTSEYAHEAAEKKEDCLKRLAGKEQYIADWYFKQKQYDSALPRYEGLLKTYPDLGFEPHALQRAAECSEHTNQKDKAKRFLAVLQDRYPNSREAKIVRRELEE